LKRKLHSFQIRRNRAFEIGWHRNGGEYRSIFDNKHYLSAILRGWNIPVPDDLAILNHNGAHWLTGRSEQSRDWPDWLADVDDGKYFIKPANGNHGRNAGMLTKSRGLIKFNGTEVDPAKARQTLLAEPGDFLLQRWIEQHPDMGIHSNATVNTIRALTVRLSPDQVILFHAVMRNGRTDRFLDNFHAGGIAVQVDVDSGETIGEGVQLRPRANLKRHPDSNRPLSGNPVPRFMNVKEILIRAHGMFPGLKSVGWDVAVSLNGPIIVEGNLDWDVEIHAFCDPNFRQSLSRLLRGN